MDSQALINRIQEFCRANGTTPTKACTQSGAGRNLMSELKKGQTVSVTRIQALAEHLGVTTSELLGEKKEPATKKGDGLSEIESIFDELTPDNRSKLLELARLYLTAQKKDEEKK